MIKTLDCCCVVDDGVFLVIGCEEHLIKLEGGKNEN